LDQADLLAGEGLKLQVFYHYYGDRAVGEHSQDPGGEEQQEVLSLWG